MHLIRDIDIVEIPEEDVAEIYTVDPDIELPTLGRDGRWVQSAVAMEVISARTFRQSKSPEECIKISLGISKKARELLGLEEAHFQAMERLVWDLREKSAKREQSILEFENTNRFKKAWWMLLGKKLTRGFE